MRCGDVLRHGKVVGHCDPRQETAASLARMMVGNDVKAVERRRWPAWKAPPRCSKSGA